MKLIHRTVIVVLLTVIFSHNTFAKGRFQFGLTGGYSLAKISKGSYVTSAPGESLHGFHAGVKGLVDFRWFQLGIGAETGNISGVTEQRIFSTTEPRYNSQSVAITAPQNVDGFIIGFYTNPYVLANAKVNVGQNSYLYAGGMVGLLTGKSRIVDDNFSSPVYGTNLGFVFQLADNIGLEVCEGWRRTEIYTVKTLKSPYYQNYPIVDPDRKVGATVHYFTTSIGIRMTF